MFARTPRALAVLFLALALNTFASQETLAQNKDLDQVCDELAEGIQQFLTDKDSCRVGAFQGPPVTGAGLAISSRLKAKLEAKKVKLGKRIATYEVRGSYRQHKERGKVRYKIKASLIDGATGDEVQEFPAVAVQDTSDVAKLAGTTFDTTVVGSKRIVAEQTSATEQEPVQQEAVSPKERVEQITTSIEKPSVHIQNGTVISASPNSPYRIEIWKKSAKGGKYQPCQVVDEEGYAFVEIGIGEVYAVKLINESAYASGVELSIDGLSAFEFCSVESYRETNKHYLPENYGKGWLIRGWWTERERVDEFEVADFPDSEAGKLAAKLGRATSKMGTITASFYAAWDKGQPQPPIETSKSRGGTKRGANVSQESRTVEPVFGESLLAQVTVRYEKPALPPAQ